MLNKLMEKKWFANKTPRRLIWAVLVVAIGIIAVVAGIIGFQHFRHDMPKEYSYETYTAANLVELHIIRTDPSNVDLRAVDDNVTKTKLYGINGGFFDGESMLSIAVNNDIPAQGTPGGYGSGWFNVKYARGTLVWDGAEGRFFVQKALDAKELQVADRNRFWAQGGISMNLADDFIWHAAAEEEHMPSIDDNHMRSGALYDRAGKLWLVVTPTLCSADQFRSAIKEAGGAALVDGIFLDGDGSSQMQTKGIRLKGDDRSVRQMLALRR